jgi:N-acetylmuramoyl-L-alanine amidase
MPAGSIIFSMAIPRGPARLKNDPARLPMSGLNLHQRPLAYVGKLERRAANRLELVVIHCTELPDLATARSCGERIVHHASGTGNSGHFYVDRDGRMEQWVPLDRVAHHVRGHNANSIGIELVNLGRFPNWLHSQAQVMSDRYPPEQIKALIALLHDLCANHSGLHNIAGHEQLDTDQVPASDNPDFQVYRKRDPGPCFPWPEILQVVPLQKYSPDEAG